MTSGSGSYIARLALALAGATLAACSTHLDADDYDRSCSVASDCTVVFVGDVCDCACNLSAINVADFPRYSDDRGSPQCSKDCGACPGADPACIDHRCEAVPQ